LLIYLITCLVNTSHVDDKQDDECETDVKNPCSLILANVSEKSISYTCIAIYKHDNWPTSYLGQSS